MRVTKYTHSCLRLEGDGVLVVDPGGFSERAAMDGADAVLITHEHPDHLDPDALTAAVARRPELRVYAHPDVLTKVTPITDQVVAVEPGEEHQAAGFTVRAYGGLHALIHTDIPRVANLGYLIDDGRQNLYHPGDSFTVAHGVDETGRVDRLRPDGPARPRLRAARRPAQRQRREDLRRTSGTAVGHVVRAPGAEYGDRVTTID